MNFKIYSIIALCAALAFLPSARAQQKLTKADIDRMMTQLSNWGRWGKDDQLGTLNLITPAKRKEAAALVKEGFAVSLARDTNGAVETDNPDPFARLCTILKPCNVNKDFTLPFQELNF